MCFRNRKDVTQSTSQDVNTKVSEKLHTAEAKPTSRDNRLHNSYWVEQLITAFTTHRDLVSFISDVYLCAY